MAAVEAVELALWRYVCMYGSAVCCVALVFKTGNKDAGVYHRRSDGEAHFRKSTDVSGFLRWKNEISM